MGSPGTDDEGDKTVFKSDFSKLIATVLQAQSCSQSPALSRQFLCSPPNSDSVLITAMVDWV